MGWTQRDGYPTSGLDQAALRLPKVRLWKNQSLGVGRRAGTAEAGVVAAAQHHLRVPVILLTSSSDNIMISTLVRPSRQALVLYFPFHCLIPPFLRVRSIAW